MIIMFVCTVQIKHDILSHWVGRPCFDITTIPSGKLYFKRDNGKHTHDSQFGEIIIYIRNLNSKALYASLK